MSDFRSPTRASGINLMQWAPKKKRMGPPSLTWKQGEPRDGYGPEHGKLSVTVRLQWLALNHLNGWGFFSRPSTCFLMSRKQNMIWRSSLGLEKNRSPGWIVQRGFASKQTSGTSVQNRVHRVHRTQEHILPQPYVTIYSMVPGSGVPVPPLPPPRTQPAAPDPSCSHPQTPTPRQPEPTLN